MKRERKNKSHLARMSERWEQRRKTKMAKEEGELMLAQVVRDAWAQVAPPEPVTILQGSKYIHNHWMISYGVCPKPPAPPPPLPRRKASEPLVAYRGWRLHKAAEGWRLMSSVKTTIWDGPVLRADGKPAEPNPHLWGGIHGIYAYKDAADAFNMGESALGRIELSGDVVVHSRGYRAEKATIVELVVMPIVCRIHSPLDDNLRYGPTYGPVELSAIIADLSATYDCPISTDWRRLLGD